MFSSPSLQSRLKTLVNAGHVMCSHSPSPHATLTKWEYHSVLQKKKLVLVIHALPTMLQLTQWPVILNVFLGVLSCVS